MNERLQEALASMMSKAVDGVEAGAAFLQAELPEVVQQLLAWKMAESLGLCALGLLLLFGGNWAAYLIAKHIYAPWLDDKYDDTLAFLTGVFGVMAVVGMNVVALAVLNLTWLQIWLAPKIYLIEYAARLAK